MGMSTFQGPIKSLNGLLSMGPGAAVAVDAAATLTPDTYAGRMIVTGAASMTLTLPPIVTTADGNGSGPGSDPNTLNNVGASYTFYVSTTASALKIITDGTDKLVGNINITDANNAMLNFPTGASTISLNMNGTTKGGISGSWFTITAVAAAKWLITGSLTGSGIIITPFANS